MSTPPLPPCAYCNGKQAEEWERLFMAAASCFGVTLYGMLWMSWVFGGKHNHSFSVFPCWIHYTIISHKRSIASINIFSNSISSIVNISSGMPVLPLSRVPVKWVTVSLLFAGLFYSCYTFCPIWLKLLKHITSSQRKHHELKPVLPSQSSHPSAVFGFLWLPDQLVLNCFVQYNWTINN